MSLRHTICSIPRRVTRIPLLARSSPTTTRHALALPHHQTRPASNLQIPGLTPPWQFSDLSSKERKAFERHGPTFHAHLTPEDRAAVAQHAAVRAAKALQFEAAYGPSWYTILREATDIKDLGERRMGADMAREGRKAGGKDGRALVQGRFFDMLKRTRQERLRDAMEVVAARVRRGQPLGVAREQAVAQLKLDYEW